MERINHGSTPPAARKMQSKDGFRTAILRLVLGALLLAVSCIGTIGYVNSVQTLDEIREKNAALVSLAMAEKVGHFLGTADTILPQLKALGSEIPPYLKEDSSCRTLVDNDHVTT